MRWSPCSGISVLLRRGQKAVLSPVTLWGHRKRLQSSECKYLLFSSSSSSSFFQIPNKKTIVSSSTMAFPHLSLSPGFLAQAIVRLIYNIPTLKTLLWNLVLEKCKHSLSLHSIFILSIYLYFKCCNLLVRYLGYFGTINISSISTESCRHSDSLTC